MKKQIIKYKGFTLVELMVAMAVTSILVVVLVSLASMTTGILDASEGKVKASRRAKVFFDRLESDITSMIIRNDDQEWFYAGFGPKSQMAGSGPTKIAFGNETTRAVSSMNSHAPANLANLIFFTAAEDKYDGYAGRPDLYSGTPIDQGGDVCSVSYWMRYWNPMFRLEGSSTDTGQQENAQMFYSRNLGFPDKAFQHAIPKNSAECAYRNFRFGILLQGKLELDGYLAPGIYNMTCIFNVSYTEGGVRKTIPILLNPTHPIDTSDQSLAANDRNGNPIGDNVASFIRISGSKGVLTNADSLWEADSANGGQVQYGDYWRPKATISNTKIDSMLVTITLLDDAGQQYINVIQDGGKAHMTREELTNRHGTTFSRLIKFPDY